MNIPIPLILLVIWIIIGYIATIPDRQHMYGYLDGLGYFFKIPFVIIGYLISIIIWMTVK